MKPCLLSAPRSLWVYLVPYRGSVPSFLLPLWPGVLRRVSSFVLVSYIHVRVRYVCEYKSGSTRDEPSRSQSPLFARTPGRPVLDGRVFGGRHNSVNISMQGYLPIDAGAALRNWRVSGASLARLWRVSGASLAHLDVSTRMSCQGGV